MGTLLNTLLSVIKTRFASIRVQIRRWTNWTFVRTQLIARLRAFFNALIDVKPRDRTDYYTVAGWMISRKFAYALIAIVGVLSLYYLVSVRNILPSSDSNTVKTYSYDSLMLRFTNDTVRILADDGYVAYEGEVADGAVTGDGTLYNADGFVVYQGTFDHNKYQGNGTLYYENGSLMYAGDFADNAFDGDGRLYYEDGTLEYTGGFTKGLMDGNGSLYRNDGTTEYQGDFTLGERTGSGSLYDSAGTLIYTGSFSRDEIVYSELLGEKVSDIWDSYFGGRMIYEQGDEYAVSLEDIDALYYTYDREGSTIDDELDVDQVIVLKDSISRGGMTLSEIGDLNEYFGESEGIMRDLSFAESIAMYLTDPDSVTLSFSAEYDDYLEVLDHSASGMAYVYTTDGLKYTFILPDGSDTFAFYVIEKEDAG